MHGHLSGSRRAFNVNGPIKWRAKNRNSRQQTGCALPFLFFIYLFIYLFIIFFFILRLPFHSRPSSFPLFFLFLLSSFPPFSFPSPIFADRPKIFRRRKIIGGREDGHPHTPARYAPFEGTWRLCMIDSVQIVTPWSDNMFKNFQ